MRTFSKLLLFSSIALLILSCSKEQPSQRTNLNTEDVFVENGILTFKDSGVFNRITDRLMNMSQDELDNWEKSIGYTTSYRRAYYKVQQELESINSQEDFNKFLIKNQKIVTFSKDSSVIPYFESPFLLRIINLNGEFKIGDELNIITIDKRWITTKNKTVSRQEIQNILRTDESKGIYVDYLKKAPTKTGKAASVTSMPPPISYGILTEKLFTASKRRLFVKLHNDYNSNNSIGKIYYSMLQESKKIWGWDANNTNYHANSLSIKTRYQSGPWLGVPTLPPYDTYVNTSISDVNIYDYRGTIIITLFNAPHYGIINLVTNGNFHSGGVPPYAPDMGNVPYNYVQVIDYPHFPSLSW